MITTGIDKRVQVQQIIDNQLPEFVLSESPKAADFLKQYYISQEYRGGPIDITDNLDQYLKLDNLTPEVITARTTLGVGITAGDDSITVSSTKGFPDQYGLLKIGDEIITYTGIAGNTFTGCERGFSGITTYHSSDDPSSLVFSDTTAASHDEDAVIQNLSALFLQEFYKKLKISLTPGLEGVDFVSHLDVNNFIKEARSFYEAKGTEESFRILFQVLYGVDPKVIDLENFLVKPSSAKYIRRERIVAERLSGDPVKLEGQTITKSSDSTSTASISEVEKLTGITGVSTAEYYNLDIFVGYDDEEYVTGTFDVPGKTRVIGNVSSGSSIITVDSTIGFSTSGTIISDGVEIDGEIVGINTNIVYTDKTINQFLGVSSITTDIISGQSLRSDEIIFGYEDGDLSKKVELRITGVLSKFVPSDDNRLSLEGETILIKGVGEIIENNAKTRKEVLANSWQYNTSTLLQIVDNANGTDPLILKTSIDKSYLKVGDTVEILERISNPLALDKQKVFITNRRVLSVTPSQNKVVIENPQSFESGKDYDLRKIITKSSSSGVEIDYGNNVLASDIQNVYNESHESLYVATNSLPSFTIENEIFKSSISSATANTTIQGYNSTTRKYSIISFTGDVPFVTGDAVQYTPGTTPLTGLREGVYYIKNVGNNQIKLYLSASFVETDGFEEFTIPTVTSSHTFTLLKHYNKKLQSQKLLKKFSIDVNLNSTEKVKTIPGPVGMLINGVEIENNRSSDIIYYGELENCSVISKGTNYDVVNPPKIDVATSIGVTALIQPVISGTLSEIQVDPQNFDIEDVLTIKVVGGNSDETVLRPVIKKRNRELEFDARIITQGGGVDTVSETITFKENHNLKSGEPLIYNRNTYPALGIGTYQGSNNPFNPGNDELVDGATYYPQVLGISSVFLYRTESDYNAGINTIGYTAVTGKNVGTHKFRLKYAKNTLNSVAIIQAGGTFENRSVFVKPEKISTIDSIINFKNHGFSEGEKIVYGGGSSVNIVGLGTTVQYKVLKQNDDSFRLANAGVAGTDNTDYIEKNYVQFTSSGTGYQEFKYPNIEIESEIRYSVDTSDKIVLTPVIRGHLTDVLLYEEGTSYGSDTVINYENKPEITIKNGVGRRDKDIKPALVPIIIDSKISKVRIDDGGGEYYSTPDLEVVGDGLSARIRPIIDKDPTSTNYLRIIDTVILNGGTGFTTSNTQIKVIPAGKNAIIDSNVRKLPLNNIQTQSPYSKKYPGTLLQESEYGLRYSVVGYSTQIGKSYFESSSPEITNIFRDFEGGHSPIIGWAYDGNPIYGPFGYSDPFDTSSVKILSPSYTLDASKVSNRPGITTYPAGFFADDYSYDASGDLDEHNGRYCVTPEFPNGVYAYFAGISSTGNMEPKFPYFIGRTYRSEPKTLDKESLINQNFDFNNSELVRNTFPYKSADKFTKTFFIESDDIVSQSAVISAVTQGDVESLEIVKSGDNYKVGDVLTFDDTGTNGNGLSATVESIDGPALSTIETTYNEYSEIKFTWKDSKKVIAHFDTPHQFEVGDKVEVSGLTTDIQSLQGTHSIGIATESTILYQEVAANATAGIITDIYVGSTSLISVGSSIGIGTESLAVINKFDDRKVLRVRRGVVGTAHTLSTEVKLNPTQFILPVETDNFESKIDDVVYFNPKQALGIGTDGDTGIGYTAWVSVGETARNVSIPAQSIYLPNHPFKTGQKVTFTKPAGKANIGVSDDGTNPLGFSIPLSGNSQDVFVINKSDDFIGIVTDIDNIGLNTETTNASPGGLYFLSNADYDFEYKFESNFEQVTGTIETISALVSVSTNHNLIANDVINLSVNANEAVGVGTSSSVIVKYNSSINKLLINPKTFGKVGVNVGTNIITLNGHDTKTGDKVYYSPTYSSISGLETGGYFVYRVDDNNIKLANTYHNVVNYPPKVINLVGVGSTFVGEISLINPNIPVIRNNDLVFDVSDSSLEGYDFNLYYDSKFENQFVSTGSTDLISVSGVGTVGVTTTATVTLKYYQDNPSSLFYNIEKTGFISTSDVSVKNGSKISYHTSDYTGEYSITGVGDTTFSILLDKKPESLIYDNGDTDVLRYTTKSKSTRGPVASIKVDFGGVGYKQMPKFVSIASTQGQNAVILPRSTKANKIEDVNITNIGFEYPSDKTLRATAKLSPVISLSDYGAIEPPIEIVDGGRGYQSAPKLVVVDEISREVNETGNLTAEVSQSTQAVDSVRVVSPPKGLNVPRIYAVDNTNSISITRVTSGSTVVTDNATGIVTFTLETPVLGFTTDPFIPNDKAFVEQVEFEEAFGGNSFNSPDNGYKFFPVVDTWVTKPGLTKNPFQMEISILDIANNPGLAKTVQTFGQVVNENRYPRFNITQKSSVFSEGETILVKFPKDNADGFEFRDVGLKLDKIANDYIKLSGKYDLKKGDRIKGVFSGSIATIGSLYDNTGKFTVDYSSDTNKGWYSDTGKLNEDYQVLPDNDYYQNLSYTIQSPIEYQELSSHVNNLLHTSGLKNFADTGISSSTSSGLSTAADATTITRDLFSENRVDIIKAFDLVTDSAPLSNPLRSKYIRFETKELVDYFKCSTNRVLTVDDIVSLFRNATNNVKKDGTLPLTESFGRFLIQSKNPTTKKIQLTELLTTIDFTNEDVYTIQKGDIFETNPLLDIIGDKEPTTSYQLLLTPSDIYSDDIDIKIFQTELGASTGIGTTSFGFVSLTSINQNVSAATTSTIISSGIGTIDSFFTTVELNDTFSNENKIVELYVTHDGTNSYISSYDFDTNTTNAIGSITSKIESGVLSVNYENDRSNEVSVKSHVVGFGTTAAGIGTYRFKTSAQNDGQENTLRLQSSYNRVSAASTILEFSKTDVTSSKSIIRVSVGNTSAIHQVLMAHDESNVYYQQYPFVSIGTTTGIGTFSSQLNGSDFELVFHPDSVFTGGDDIQVQTYSEVFNSELDLINLAPDLQYGSGLEIDSLSLLQYDSINGTRTNRNEFKLTHNEDPIFGNYFNPSDVVDLATGTFNIPNNFFYNDEKLLYTPGSSIDGIGTGRLLMSNGNPLPEEVYVKASGTNSDSFQLSTTKAGAAVTFIGLGTGNYHLLEMSKKNEKSLITLDGMVQSPLAYTPITETITNNVAGQVGISTTLISVSGISSIILNDVLKIDNEYMKVTNIGVGTTSVGPITENGTLNILEVERGFVGTSASTHADNTTLRLYRGAYNIVGDSIYFTEPPSGVDQGLKASSNRDSGRATFSGRVYLRQDYSTNAVFDDISGEFTGIGQTFTVKVGGANTAGIVTGSTFVALNGLFQSPTTENNQLNNYDFTKEVSGITSFVFSGITSTNGNLIVVDNDPNQNQLPRGGQIISIGSSGGLGIAPLVGASVTAVTNSVGNITSVGIGSTDYHGSGYTLNGNISIGITDVAYTHRFVSAGVNSITVNPNGIGAYSTFTPTDATFKSDSGELTLIKSSHGLITADTYTATTGTYYNGTVGILTVKLSATPSPALANGQIVRISNESLTFTCKEDNDATQHLYPRVSDPIAGRYVPISNVTGGDTFEINVLKIAGAPSSNVSTHTFVSGITNGISRSANTVGIATTSMAFRCSSDYYKSIQYYPRSTDEANGAWLSIKSATDDSITVGVGSAGGGGTGAVITATVVQGNIHTYVSGLSSSLLMDGTTYFSPYSIGGLGNAYDPVSGIMTVTTTTPHGLSAAGLQTATAAVYNPHVGIMTITTNGSHGYNTGDYVKIAENSLTFTCAKDNNDSTHTYPRATDPIFNKWVQITKKTATQFSIQVLDSVPSTNTTDHTFVSGTTSGILKANNTVGIGTSAFTFTCTQDSNVSLHSYPRKDKQNPGSDPAYNTTLGVESVGTTTSFTLNVGKSPAGSGGALKFSISSAGKGYVNPRILPPAPAYENLDVLGISRLGIGLTTDTGTSLQMDINPSPSSTTGIGSISNEVNSFDIKREGFGFKRGDVFTPIGIVTDRYFSSLLTPLEFTVNNVFTDAFASWNVGEFDYIDSIKDLQDGFRTRFPLNYNDQLVSFQKDDAVEMDIQALLLIFVNGVLQVPGESYTFGGGTTFAFTEPPDVDDTVVIFFYKGTNNVDVTYIDVDETIKVGDQVQIFGDGTKTNQEKRTISGITTSDTVETNLYYGKGIDAVNPKPLTWIKQKIDKTINGEVISKVRPSIEPLVFPNARIIADFTTTDNEMFVDTVELFDYEGSGNMDVIVLDESETLSGAAFTATISGGSVNAISIASSGSGFSTTTVPLTISPPRTKIQVGVATTATATATISGGNITSITITNPGLGYTVAPHVIAPAPVIPSETVAGITQGNIDGFSGIVTGITTAFGSGGTGTLALKFFLNKSSGDFTELQNGYPIYVYDTNIGTGVTSIYATGNDSVVGIGTTFIDNIYYVSSINRTGLNADFIANVDSNSSIIGIGTTGEGSGKFSWGRLSGFSRSATPISIGVTSKTINAGLSTFPRIQRRNIGIRKSGGINKST